MSAVQDVIDKAAKPSAAELAQAVSKKKTVAIKVTDESAIIRQGEKIIIPEKMTFDEAILTLAAQKEYDQQSVVIHETVGGAYWDGAYAFYRAMQRKFGWVQAKAIPSFFGEQKPQLVSIPSGPFESILVPIGRFEVPGIEGYLQTSHMQDERGVVHFRISAQVLRKSEQIVRELAQVANEIVDKESIYRGKAVRISFNDHDGNRKENPTPEFIDVSSVNPDSLILPKAVHDAVSTNIFTPIRNTMACIEHGIPLKRGVLLSGPYGTGKTLAAYVTGKYAQDNGWTFVYCEKADELEDAIRFAHQYQPAVLFCEDIDREMSGERSEEIDAILNIIDGIESKGTSLMVVLTTNHVENINQAMLRPGRLDAIINFQAPDAKAVEALVRYYGKGLVRADGDITRVGAALAGQIPAVIRECVERAKLSAIKVQGASFDEIDADSMIDAAEGMKLQLDLLAEKKAEPSDATKLGTLLIQAGNGELDT